jgi:Tol biopolymer transport system component
MKRGIFLSAVIILALVGLALLPFFLALAADQVAELNRCVKTPLDWGEGICRDMYTLTVLASILAQVITPIGLVLLGLYMLGAVLILIANRITSRRANRPASPVISGMGASSLGFLALAGMAAAVTAGVSWYQGTSISACRSLPVPLSLPGVHNGPLALGVMLPEPAGLPQQYAILLVSPDGDILARLRHLPGSRDPAWSPDGSRLVFAAQSSGEDAWGLYLADAQGQLIGPVLEDSLPMTSPSWSADGALLLFERWLEDSPNPDSEIFTLRLEEGGPHRLPGSPAFEGSARFSPDGSQIVFTSQRAGQSDIYRMNADGSGLQRLTRGGSSEVDPAWSPDGQWIVFASNRGSPAGRSNYNLYIMAPDGANQCRLTNGAGSYRQPAWSPDGSWIAYISLLETQAYLIQPDGAQEIPLPVDEALFNLLSLDWARQP